jgi:glycosyltransferase involved in cell wall biosynthesis
MQGENIVCFAKDWDDDPTRNTHVMRLLARDNTVLWLNSIAMRAPQLANPLDYRRGVRRIQEAVRGAVHVRDGLWTLSPFIVPLPHSRAATALNRWMLRRQIGLARRRLGMRDFQLWTFLPSAVEYVGTLGESLVVYYCTDDWLNYGGFDGVKLRAKEERLCARADVVFTTSRALEAARRAWNPQTYLASHGVEHAHFAQALDRSLSIAPEVAALPQPVLGIVALFDERIDRSLLATVARSRPDWTIAIVGRVTVDTAALAALPNVRFLGRQPYARLPEFCKGFAAGLIPFVVTDFTRHINPIKLREYLSAGLPVVSTSLPEVASYAGLCAVAGTPAEFVDGVGRALAADSPAARAQRSAAMQRETWEAKVDDLGRMVLRAKDVAAHRRHASVERPLSPTPSGVTSRPR